MRPGQRVLLLVVGLALGACSSAPPPPEGVQDRKNRAADYLKFGRQAYQETQYEQALSFYRLAVDFDTAVDYEPGMAAAWNSVATALTALGRLDEAAGALAQAATYAGLAGDKALSLQVAVNQAQAETAAGQTQAARTRLTAWQPYPETAEGAALWHALGALEKAEDKPEAALAALDKALTLNLKLGLKQEAAANRFLKASVYGRQNLWTAARTELQEALVLDRSQENTLGLGQDWRALGMVALKLNEAQAAFDAYVRAFRLFEAAGLADQQLKTLDLLLPVTRTLGLADETARYEAIRARLRPTAP